ncbi:MAG: hypothetical protein JO168_02005 [Solirubrobacterales bacterium]|nr:hypothetical protein [Solirubrobacterales bacterium]MBV9716429.1 hypothetical protein [Solirubrobacterales bacterium]
MKRSRMHGMAAITTTALIAVGCGASSYTRRDFIARADAICASALRQTRSIAPGTALSAYLSAFVPVLQSEESQLRALRRPPGTAQDRAILAQYFAALAQTVAEYRRLAAAVKNGNEQRVTDAEAALGSSPVYSLATSYGLSSCGTPGSTAV